MHTKLLHGAQPFSRSYTRNSPHFIEPESPILCSEQPATCPYPQQHHSSPCPNPISWTTILILSFPSMPTSSKWCLHIPKCISYCVYKIYCSGLRYSHRLLAHTQLLRQTFERCVASSETALCLSLFSVTNWVLTSDGRDALIRSKPISCSCVRLPWWLRINWGGLHGLQTGGTTFKFLPYQLSYACLKD